MTLRRTLLLLVPFLTCRLATGQHQPDCSEARLNECKATLSRPHDFDGNGPFFSQEQIQQGCSSLLQADQCITEIMESCPEHKEDASHSIQPEIAKQIRTCKILVDKYVKKLGCYEAMNETYQRCLEYEKKSFPYHIQNVMNGNRELQEEGCCNIQLMFTCILKPTAEKCDPEAHDILSDFLNTTLPENALVICRQFHCPVDRPPTEEELDKENDHHEHHSRDSHEPHKNAIDDHQNVGSLLHVQIATIAFSLIISVNL